MEEQENNNEDSFIKEQAGKAKDKAKEQAKKRVRQKIMAVVVAHLPVILTILAITFSIIILIMLFCAFLNILDDLQVENAADAKSKGVNLSLTQNSEYEEGKKGIKISYENGVYNISTNLTEEELQEVKDELITKGRDIKDFSDFEIEVIGALMKNGLDVDSYKSEELKLLPLFIKAEACTGYLDLRPNSEKFDSTGNYKPLSIDELEENQIPGTILLQRTNTREGSSTTLEYVNEEQFNDMLSDDDLDVMDLMKYFTINEHGNLVIATWEHKVVEVEGEYPEGVPQTEPEDIYTIGLKEIAYSEYVKKYKMPFDFLIQLLTITEEPEFCTDFVDVVLDSKIVIDIQEEETISTEVDKQTYDVHNKQEKFISYTVTNSSEDGESDDSQDESEMIKTAQDDEGNACTTYSMETKEVIVTTTITSHTYTCQILEADTWIVHYLKTYQMPPEKQEIVYEPQTIETKGEYGEPTTTETTDKSEISEDSDGKNLIEGKEGEESDEDDSNSSYVIVSIKINSYKKIDEKQDIEQKKEKYILHSNPPNIHIYAKNEQGEFEKFLAVYDNHKYARAMFDSVSSWLFDMMKNNENTVDLVDIIKYLLYVYDGTDYGVTELDTSIFEPDEFVTTIGGGVIVKTDEIGAAQALDKAQLEEVIEKRFSGKKKENLISVIDDLIYIQDTYHVNAVFAISVIQAESGCGTAWALISSKTYNWCSVSGSYNGAYYEDTNGTKWRSYSSFSEATRDFGDLIANSSYYFQAGKYTPFTIGPTYCNEEWGNQVQKFIMEMYESIGITIQTGVGNEVQQKIVEVAKNSASYGISAEYGYCQSWVASVYEKAGANSTSACCAIHAGSMWGVSTNWNEIQEGATVYGYASKSSSSYVRTYGHVGIYIGNGMVAHNVGGVKFDTLEDWIDKYTGVCWGWNGGTDITGGLYPCNPGLMTPNH